MYAYVYKRQLYIFCTKFCDFLFEVFSSFNDWHDVGGAPRVVLIHVVSVQSDVGGEWGRETTRPDLLTTTPAQGDEVRSSSSYPTTTRGRDERTRGREDDDDDD
jgi:hypothetical protein